MRHVFIVLAAALIALPTLAEEKKPQEASTPAGSSSDAKPKGVAHVGPRRKFGRVLSQQGRMFTITSDGKELTFSGANLKELPKVGEVVEITFTQAPGGPLEATTVKSSKSNSSDRTKR